LADAALAGTTLPDATQAERAWLEREVPRGPAIGLDPAGLPPGWTEVLSRCGLPLAPGGAWRWAVDLAEDPDLAVPRQDGGLLLLPPPARLGTLTSLPLKPLRLWVAQRSGVRLQIGADIHLRLWSGRALLVSTAHLPLSGFLSGPTKGTRASIHVAPGGTQHVVL
jgi:hypothetical protein